jgi:sn-glycerol 3-phosphate transport system substrate-binding protein
VGDGSLWITAKTSPAKQAAAWRFVRFLVEPEQIAGWMLARSGYVPVRRSAAESPAVQQLWREHPEYSTAYEQLLQPGGPAADGSIIGDYQGVRDAVTDGIVSMLAGRRSVEQALKDTETLATSRIRAYNERVGG